ncbi:MAG: glycosyltransferase family 9 protein [Candidatus Pelagibacterales bacterium]|jgi:ADP-heptose:LPS heptosyltransferase|nr:glycosyltransferase family 9 protein [Pelagibacterales bacterium]MBL6861428.1 glycosyltransferase family 9 protein [Pelagibacterales bacterium]|tara:strand:+ start:1834 stop:2763 length:930 start_codon:yes stop_codon:yes gene_type:complete
MSNNILIIKHGALGDLIQITNALKSIRHKYPESKITLLTDIKFKFFSDRIIFIDEIIYENRPSFLRIDEWLTIILKIARRNFNIVFDLQNSDRTSVYYFFIRLFNSKVIWSGNRKGGKYKYHPKNFESVPIKDRIKNQLALMNIEIYDNPDISWMLNKNIINLPNNDFVILLPGSSLEHKHKRWPAEKFAELANHLKERNIDSIILGQSHSEGEELKKIKLLAPKIIDFSNQDLDCLATTASKAIGAIGNDTGPTFIAAAAGCPITWLLSSHTDPNITQLLGSKVNTLKKDNISDITTDEVKNNLALRD